MALQSRLEPLFRRQLDDPASPRTVVVVPSLSFDPDELAKIRGIHHYEERMLCMLMLLRLPKTEVVFVTSQAIDATIVDYHLHLLTGVPTSHARRRLRLYHCHDGSSRPLTRKILDRPQLVAKIRRELAEPATTHLTCFHSTALERSLAVRLGVPLFACDPALLPLGTKSGSRKLFRERGIPHPAGAEDLRDLGDAADALVELRRQEGIRRAVVKLDEGFSGEGNALFTFDDDVSDGDLPRWVKEALPRRLELEAPDLAPEAFAAKYAEMGGIVEAFVEGEVKRSPSVQHDVDPLGNAVAVSTHDQVLGGTTGQKFLGCTFPADGAYRLELQGMGDIVAEGLAEAGVRGRFGVDFVSVQRAERWEHQAIEINLRKGGTTHPMMTMVFLTDGRYDPEQGTFLTPAGPRFYYASDNVEKEAYRGMLPDDLIDIAVDRQLHFHPSTQEGVAFHLIGALSEFGKLGMVCIGRSADVAADLHARTVASLDAACAELAPGRWLDDPLGMEGDRSGKV